MAERREKRRGRPRNPVEKVSLSIRLELELMNKIMIEYPDWRDRITQAIRKEFERSPDQRF